VTENEGCFWVLVTYVWLFGLKSRNRQRSNFKSFSGVVKISQRFDIKYQSEVRTLYLQKDKHHGYPNPDQVFHVVHDLEPWVVDLFISYAGVRWRFCLHDAWQMVPYATGEVQRSDLLFYRLLQDHRYCFQRSTLDSVGDNRVK